MEFNRGDYVKLTEDAAQEIGVVWEIDPTEIASLKVYWLGGGKRWSLRAEEFNSREANRASGLRYRTKR